MNAARFNQYMGTPNLAASLHFVRGYDVTYDSNTDSDSIEVTLFQFDRLQGWLRARRADKFQIRSRHPRSRRLRLDVPQSGHIRPWRGRHQGKPGIRDRCRYRERRPGTPGGEDGAPAVRRAVTSRELAGQAPRCASGTGAESAT